MNKRVIFGLTAAALFALPAASATTSDWDAVVAQLNATNSYALKPDIIAAIDQNSMPPSQPSSWTVYLVPQPTRLPIKIVGRLQGHVLTQVSNEAPGFVVTTQNTDSTGLITLRSATMSFVPDILVGVLEFSARPQSSDNPAMAFKAQELNGGFGVKLNSSFMPIAGSRVGVADRDCRVFLKDAEHVGEQCNVVKKEALFRADPVNSGPSSNVEDYTFTYIPALGVYFDLTSYFFPHEPRDLVMDWSVDNRTWRSQQVSAGLTAARKEQARGLFARGFDLYKAGDFDGSGSLIFSGLQIDPGNYLAWFTLGEINRSKGMNSYSFYQHTIDLAPDSPEAALAKGYLAALR